MFTIPDEKLPNCLKDEQRINVLFAPLRNRTVNSKDWESKISSWKCIIRCYCEVNNIYSFTLSSLSDVFIRNGRPPACLKEVLADMERNNEVQLMDVFLRKNSNTWSGWAADVLIKRPLSWSYNKLKNSIVPTSTDGNFVHLELVKCRSEELLRMVPDKYKNKVISLKQLMELTNHTEKVENIKLLLHYLVNCQKVDVTATSGKDELESFLIKVSDGSKMLPITDTDIGIHTLERNEIVMTEQIETLEEQIQSLVKEAKVHLARNHRQMAKNLLRRKHDLEKRVDKKINALHNIQILLEQVHDTHSDVDVWDAYKKALSVFNTTTRETGISEDSVDDTMIQIGDMLDSHNEIQSALARPATDLSEFELEDELAELLKESDDSKPPNGGLNVGDINKQMEGLSLNLPDVPDNEIHASQRDATLDLPDVLGSDLNELPRDESISEQKKVT